LFNAKLATSQHIMRENKLRLDEMMIMSVLYQHVHN